MIDRMQDTCTLLPNQLTLGVVVRSLGTRRGQGLELPGRRKRMQTVSIARSGLILNRRIDNIGVVVVNLEVPNFRYNERADTRVILV